MKSLFNQATVDELKQRIASLQPDTPRLWGKMNVAQMLAHCSVGMEISLGDKSTPQVLLGKIFGKWAKAGFFRNGSMRKNTPTAPIYVVANPGEFAQERDRLSDLIQRFQASGPAGCTTGPHAFFGKLQAHEWAILNYVHVDHHLKQFGV